MSTPSDNIDSETDSETSENSNPNPLPWHTTFCYGVGHFYNDLCACMWFSYLMLFLQKVLKFQSWRAGLLMLIGQTTDAICTPLVGLGSDRGPVPGCFKRLGKRKSWHLLGTLCVTISFPLIFSRCYFCTDDTEEWIKVVYFIPLIMLFQFGWASVQISHLALIPELSHTLSHRTTLNSIRYGFTVLANITVFGLIIGFLATEHGAPPKISPHDEVHMRNCAFVVIGIGCYVAAVFHFGIKESSGNSESDMNQLIETSQKMNALDWLKEPQFYQIALLYMMARLYINVSQVYFSFYIQFSEDFHKMYIAIFPLVVYFSAFVTSSLISIPKINKHLNRKCLYMIGIISGVICCIWLWFKDLQNQVFGVSILMGFSQAILLVTSLALTADLINKNIESGAFVYGLMSFTDKLSNGITYQIIELFNPSCDPSKPHEACAIFYRDVMALIPGVCLIVAAIVLLTLLPQTVGKRHYNNDKRPIIVPEPDDVNAEL